MYPRSITDMCCCQLASAVAHLLPVLTSSCLCFVAPKQGPDSGPKNGATILKLVAQLPNVWSPILGPWYMPFAFCKECVELRQVASSIHVFLRLVPGCWFHSISTVYQICGPALHFHPSPYWFFNRPGPTAKHLHL